MFKGQTSEQRFGWLRDITNITSSLFEPKQRPFDRYRLVPLGERAEELLVRGRR